MENPDRQEQRHPEPVPGHELSVQGDRRLHPEAHPDRLPAGADRAARGPAGQETADRVRVHPGAGQTGAHLQGRGGGFQGEGKICLFFLAK